jgi:hypothetical protein
VKTKSTLNAVSAAIMGNGMPKPGASVSISISAPITKATMPPKPSVPNVGRKASAIRNASPRKMSPRPT